MSDTLSIRANVKEICHNAEHSKDISFLLECVTQLSEYLFYIQEEESKLNSLVTDAKILINNAKESIKETETEAALRMNSIEGGSVAMNKAEKLAYIESKPLREELNVCEEAYAEVDKQYKDVKGFKSAVSEYIMTLRQRVKNLQVESGAYPQRRDDGEGS